VGEAAGEADDCPGIGTFVSTLVGTGPGVVEADALGEADGDAEGDAEPAGSGLAAFVQRGPASAP
jgi:hypothetical protein